MEFVTSRRGLLGAAASAVSAAVSRGKPGDTTAGQDGRVILGRIEFDASFTWDREGVMEPPQTPEEYRTLLGIALGEHVALEPRDEKRGSIYPCCRLVARHGSVWRGLLYDKYEFDLWSLRSMEDCYPVYAVVQDRRVQEIDMWPERAELVTLTLEVFAVLDEEEYERGLSGLRL